MAFNNLKNNLCNVIKRTNFTAQWENLHRRISKVRFSDA